LCDDIVEDETLRSLLKADEKRYEDALRIAAAVLDARGP
jgi:hypothetical protein